MPGGGDHGDASTRHTARPTSVDIHTGHDHDVRATARHHERTTTMTTFHVALPGAQAPTLMWADPALVEPAALDQLRNISRLPWVHGLRVMPDVHLGKGATVGSVIAMRQAVSPAAVGVDIGCGMEGVLTSLTAADLPAALPAIRSRIEAAVPVGFRAHESAVSVRKLGLDRGWDRF